MNNRIPVEVFPPGDFLREELDERGWTQADLAEIIERPVQVINGIITGKRSITPETAKALSAALGTSAEFWLNLENTFRLSKAVVSDGFIRQRADIFKVAPIKIMQKRGWIRKTKIEESEAELVNFFEIQSLSDLPSLRVAAKASVQNGSQLLPEQLVWCVKCLKLAKKVPVKRFSNRKIGEAIDVLKTMTDFPEKSAQVPKILGEFGIRFVVVEHLPRTKIDGAALWLGDGWDQPVIALSLRYDRIDSFWHTLLHEISHIQHGDSYIVDEDLNSGDRCLSSHELSEVEERANREASESLVPQNILESFMNHTRPFYNREKIIQFANRVKIHPGIIAGQLQFRGEIQYSANRDMLVKIRNHVISTAMTDGWGSSL